MTKTGSRRNANDDEQLKGKSSAFIWDTLSYSAGEDQDKNIEVKVDRKPLDDRMNPPERNGKGMKWSNFIKTEEDGEPVTEVHKVWNNFTRETTFHGVKHIDCRERNKHSKGFWLLLVLGMAGGLIYTTVSLMIDYYQYKTITKTEIKVGSSLIFPTITLCNTCPYKNLDGNLQSALGRVAANMSIFTGDFPLNYSDPSTMTVLQMSLYDLWEKYSYTAEELFSSAQYERQKLNISDAFEARGTPLGRCFTFNGPNYIEQNGPRKVTYDGRESGLQMYVNLHQDNYYIYGDITAGIRMYITHHPDTPRLSQDGIDIAPGTSTRVALTPVEYTFLPAPYESYGDKPCEEIDSIVLGHKISNSNFYSYETCLDQCSSLVASNSCNCSSSVYEVQHLRVCTLGEAVACFLKVKASVKPETCDCPRPCSFTRYDTTISASQIPSTAAAEHMKKWLNVSSVQRIREDFLEIRVYMDTLLSRNERHEPQFTFNSIFAFLGGQMGFFMGASLITMAELLETVTISIYVWIKNRLSRDSQIDTLSQPKMEPTKQAWK